MELFVALGMEMGSWTENTERKYFVMLLDEKINLNSEQYDLWILGQQAGFTVERAAQYLKKEEFVIRQKLEELENKGVIIFWNPQILDRLDSFLLTPRGHAGTLNKEGKQQLISYVHAKPIAVDTFGHALWMYSNGIITVDKIMIIVANRIQLSLDEVHRNVYYWIPFLIRHGLAVLNPIPNKGN